MKIIIVIIVLTLCSSCNLNSTKKQEIQSETRERVSAKDILGNSDYLAISYGGYRTTTRDVQPTVSELKEDMKILHAMNIRLLRTYNVQLAHASNVLEAIHQLKEEDQNFEMYVMLGAWIDCKGAWTATPNHNEESAQNEGEVERTVALANKYPDIVKIIAVGNEAMVKWAAGYYVQPEVILKWVDHLQELKKEEKLPKDIWITSSDNFASWGGGSDEYHVESLEKLIKAVDYISMHTYPMHDTHYNPDFWAINDSEEKLTKKERIDAAMLRAKGYATSQYDSVVNYMKSIGVNKPVHIGETGWASISNGHYGSDGSKATDEYKEAMYYVNMRDWTRKNQLSCFYFEAFDEPWKDAQNPRGSENHFGLFTVDGKAKYALWNLVDNGVFEGLTRGGNIIAKTYNGNEQTLLKDVALEPIKKQVITDH